MPNVPREFPQDLEPPAEPESQLPRPWPDATDLLIAFVALTAGAAVLAAWVLSR